MSDVWVVRIVGIALILAGTLLYAFGKDRRGNNRIKALGIETELSTPSLMFLVLGVLVFLSPSLLPGTTEPASPDPKPPAPADRDSGDAAPAFARQAADPARRSRPSDRLERAFDGARLAAAVRQYERDPLVGCALAEMDRDIAETPPGSNSGPRIDLYYRTIGSQPDGKDWAAAFASYCLVTAGMEAGLDPNPSTADMYSTAPGSRLFIRNNQRSDPPVGSLLFRKTPRGNYDVAIIANVDPTEGIAIIVGGNQNDSVAASRIDYFSDAVRGWIEPRRGR